MLTPEVLIAVLATLGIAAGAETVKVIREYQASHRGTAPAPSQVTLTDNQGNTVTLAEVANVARSMSAPPEQFQESIPLNSGLKPIPESIPADSGIKPFQESMPSQTLKAPQESADLIKNPIQDTEKFPIGVQAPPNGAVNEKPSTPAEPPKTEEGKQIQAQQAAKQAIPIPLTEEEWNKVIQDVKTAPDADLNPKTVEGKKLLAKELADKQARQAEVAQLATDAKTFNEIMAKNEELLINMKTADTEWETHTNAGKALKAKIKAQQVAQVTSLREASAQLVKTQEAIRDMRRAVASADFNAGTQQGYRIKMEYKAAQAAEVTAMRDAAAQLEKTKAAIRDMERAVASADFKAYTADGIKIKTDIQAARAAEIKQLKDSAATVAKFEEIIQRIQAEQGTVNFKTMSEIINKNRENETMAFPSDANQVKADWTKGKIAPSDSTMTPLARVQAVEIGVKPAAHIPGTATEALKYASEKGLIASLYHDDYIIYKNNSAGKTAYRDILDASRDLNSDNPKNEVQDHIKMGKAFGYSDNDIARYLHEYYSSSVVKSAPEWYRAVTGKTLTQANEIKMYKQNIDQADGGSWLIHGDDGSILFSVLEEADTTTATDVQRTAALEQLKKLYDARQINYQEY